jgi:hypothetical protein
MTIFRARRGAQQFIHAQYCIVCATLRAGTDHRVCRLLSCGLTGE